MHMLTVYDRARIMQLLPKEGRMTTLKVADALRQLCELTDAEIDEWDNMALSERARSQVSRQPMADTAREFALTERMEALIHDELDRKEKESTLGLAFVDLYERFYEAPEAAKRAAVAAEVAPEAAGSAPVPLTPREPQHEAASTP